MRDTGMRVHGQPQEKKAGYESKVTLKENPSVSNSLKGEVQNYWNSPSFHKAEVQKSTEAGGREVTSHT